MLNKSEKMKKIRPGYEDKADLTGLEAEDLELIIKQTAPFYRKTLWIDRVAIAFMAPALLMLTFSLMQSIWAFPLASLLTIFIQYVLQDTGTALGVWLSNRRNGPKPPSNYSTL